MKNKASYIRTSMYILIAIFLINMLYLFDFKDFSINSFLTFLSILIAFSGLLFTVMSYKKSKIEAIEKERKELLERQPSFLFNEVTSTRYITRDVKYITYDFQYTFSMENIGKVAKHLTFSHISNLEKTPKVKEILLPNHIDFLLNSTSQNITFTFVTINEFWAIHSTDFNFELTYRDMFGDERVMPLILTVEPNLNIHQNNQTYSVRLKDNAKNLK